MSVSFAQLWAIARQIGTGTGHSPSRALASIGLILEPPERPWKYFCTPKNVLTFASTGHDGIHYSLLSGPNLAETPVVMTVPMNFENPNMVISETLHEFLCLGCRLGYRKLEVLAELGQDYAIFKSLDYARWLSDEQKQLLAQLTKAFNLYPYRQLEGRMTRLQARYLDRLQLGEHHDNIHHYRRPVRSKASHAVSQAAPQEGRLEIEIQTR